MNSENGTSGPCCGQYSDHSPYSLRPIRKALVVDMPAPTISPMASSKYGKCHWSGRSTTPSREMKKFDTIRPMGCAPHCGDPTNLGVGLNETFAGP